MHSAEQEKGLSAQHKWERWRGRDFVWLVWMVFVTSVLGNAFESQAADLPLFGPKTYSRVHGKPATITDSFNGCASGTSGVLRLANGSDKDTRVSSAVVILNGTRVIGEHDLNKKVPALERTVALKPGTNILSVTVKSGEGDDDRHDGKNRHHENGVDTKGNTGGHDDVRNSSGGDSDKAGKGEHHDYHGEGNDDGHHQGDDDHRHDPALLVIEILGRGCDAIPPTISTILPIDGTLVNIARPVVSASYSDNSGGSGVDITSVRVSIDGADISTMCSATATDVTCALTGDLADGTHTATVVLSDLAMNPASYSWRFTTDTTPPQVAVTSPQSGQHLGNPVISVTGIVDDPTAKVTVISTSLGTATSTTLAMLTGLNFSAADVPLSEGANTLTVTAVDQAGNRSTMSVDVTLDTSLPVVTITAPVNGSFTSVPMVNVSGSISEAPAGVTVNGRAAVLTGQTFILESIALAEGQNTISVEARDLADNRGIAVATVTLDTVNPQIFVTVPPDGLLTRNPQLTVSGTISELLTSLTVNGQPATFTEQTFSTPLTLNEGANSIILEAADRAGNKGIVQISVALDSTPPSVPLLEVLTSPTNNPIVVVKGSAEPGSSVALSAGAVQLASTTADASGLFSFSNITLTEGETLFTVQATDQSGNAGQSSAPLAVILDTVAPSAAINTPLDGTSLDTPTITVSGSIDDPAAVVTVNGLPALNSGGVWTLDGFTLQEGSNTLQVEARDPAGNKGSTSATVVLDTIPPVVTITTPVDGLYTNIVQGAVIGMVNESVVSVTVISTPPGAGTPRSATITEKSFTLSDLTLVEGANFVTVEATDLAGNRGTATVSVNLDTIAPQLTVIGPDDGSLLNNGQITFGGSAAEPVVSVLVNGVVAQVGANGGYTLPVTLVEGSNTLTITANDRAGNQSSSTITVNLDSTAPAAPLLDPLPTPTRTATTTVSGKAEASSTVKLFNNGVLITTLTADAAGLFSAANIALTEGNNPFTAQATDAAGNVSQLSAPLTVVLDTKAPVITVSAPQAGVVVSAPQVTITGMVDETLASLTVNGASTPLSAETLGFEYILALAAGENSALITATDLAGNVATMTIIIQRDSTPPTVVITAPLNGLLTNIPQIQVAGTVDDAEATLTVGGGAVSVSNRTFTASYLLSDGDNSIQVKAVDMAGNEGTASVLVTLDAQPPVVTLSAPATATAGTNVSITINATDNRNLTLAELRANGVPIWSASPTSSASATETIGYRLSPDLSAGAEVTLQARALDAAGNEGVFTSKIIISHAAAGPGYVQGKVLDDIRGLRMEGATVTVTDSKGGTKTATSGSDGGYFFEIPSGEALVKITRPGYTAIERRLAVRPEQKVTVLDARLTKANDTKGLVDATGGVVKSTPFKIQSSSFTIDLTIPVNALTTEGDLRITPVSNQGLIGTLPLGWSPLAVADMRLLNPATGSALDSVTFVSVATAKFTMPAIANLATATLTLARYDETAHQWLAAGSATPATDGVSATADILTSGQYAVVIPDPAPNAPAAAQSGQPLAAASLQSLDFSLTTATGRVIPQAALPSAGLKAAGEVVVNVKADAAQQPVFTSGLLLGGRITEKFDLLSGDKVEPVSYTQDLVLYRQPCITNIGAGAVSPLAVSGAELRSTFPVSPSRDYTIVDLLLGKVGIEILPPDTTETGVMVGSDGGRILDADGNVLVISQGALSQATPVSTKSVAASAAIGDDFTLLKTVEVIFTRQTLATSATLSIPAPTGLDVNLPLVIARGVTVKGVNKLKLVALAKQNGSFITSAPLAPELQNSINSSGNYYFLQAKGQIGFITGTITDASNNPFAGAYVKTDSGSLIDLAENSGKYLLAVPVAAFNATAADLYKGDEVTAAGAITAANQVITLNLSIRMIPPRIVSITPANGATNVQPSVPVVVTFSKPMDKTTINATTLKLTNLSNSEVVPGVLTFNVDNTAVTFYPSDTFKQEIKYTVTVSSMVKDVQGYPLGQDVVSSFTVRKTTPPPMPPAGSVSGTFPDADGFITVTATQGSAPADCTVLLINDTSGEIQSVTPQSNGSFTGKVRGQLGDEIKVVIMDYSGNQTLVSYLTFKSPDGSYLVTAKGGKVEGDAGALLDIPEGALATPAIVKLSKAAEENLPYSIPDKGKYLAAFNIDTGGMNFQKEVHLSIPAPEGFDTSTAVFVTRPTTIYNSDDTTEQVYEIVDSTKVINGRITTASPPFDGIFAFGIFAFVAFPTVEPVILSGYTYQEMNDLTAYQEPPGGVIETPAVSRDAAGNPVYTYSYDQPVSGAVIRSPWAWNYVSYSNAKGFYATFSSLVASVGVPCKDYTLAAINPYTMLRKDFKGQLCEPPNNVERLNFKLGDKGTIPPDKTKPIIDAVIKVAPGQAPEYRIVSGTVPVNTKLLCPISVTDEGIRSATLLVNFKGDDVPPSNNSVPVTLVRPPAPVLVRNIARGVNVPVYRYDFITQFNSDPVNNYFLAEQRGEYTFVIETTDNANNTNTLSRTIRVAAPGGVLPTGREGAPSVDAVSPLHLAGKVAVTSPVVVTFSEPVGNVTEATFKLLDLGSTLPGVTVPATITLRLEGNRTVATLTPNNNLWFGRTYKVVLTTGIKDENVNATALPPYAPPTGDGKLPLVAQYESTFTTITPEEHDLDAGEQFTGGREIDLYDFTTSNGDQKSYAYVAAGDNGWRVVDVSDPSGPTVLNSKNMTNSGVNWAYRGVSINPATKIMGMTDNVTYSDGNHYGYVRFYDLSTTPEAPPIVGREKLAEAFSGIPGRLALFNDYAYIATAAAGLQIVDVKAAIERQRAGKSADGSTIVGVFDNMGQNYGSPNDVAVFNAQKALVTTNSGYLLALDINTPYFPIAMNAYRPANTSFVRAAIAPEYEYSDENGLNVKIDLAVAGTRDGRLVTIDMTDGYNPTNIGTAATDTGSAITTHAMDISIEKNEKLAILSTLNTIKVFDIRDPRNPRLRNEFTPQPDAATGTATIGSTPALVARDGWIYMANMKQGMRTMGVNTNDIIVYNEEKVPVTELGYSKGGEPQRSYNIAVKFEDPEITCGNDDLEGNLKIKTRNGGTVNPLPGIDHPTQYQLSFRKGTDDDKCYADLNLSSTAKRERFIATNFPASDPTVSTVLSTTVPVFGSIGTKAVFEFSNRNDGRLMKRKSVNLEKLIRIAFDGNRDGKVKFKDPEDNKFTFWVNDDRDVGRDIFDPGFSATPTHTEYDDSLSATSADLDDDIINTLRDLEDFAPLHVQVGEHAQQVIKRLQAMIDPPPTFTYHLSFKNTNSTNPVINVFEAVGEGYEYLYDTATAKRQVYKDPKLLIQNKMVATAAYNTSNNQLPLNKVTEDGKSFFIFEGKTQGSGDMVFSLKSDGVAIEESMARLDLKPITYFYDKFQVNYLGTGYNVSANYTYANKGEYQPKDNDYVLYVHGWNMANGEDEKERWAETMFKRLWWQGYTGKVGLFSWPTLEGMLTFDESEVRAWNSAGGLKNLLLSDDMAKYRGRIRLLGHSMGGVVSGEAINKLPGAGIVHTYIPTQAALSANYFDNTVSEPSLVAKQQTTLPYHITTPNIYSYYFTGTPWSTDKPYLQGNTDKTKFINYFNTVDFALNKGDESFSGAWESNNAFKPDNITDCYKYEGGTTRYNVGVDLFYRECLSSPRINLLLSTDRYEIFGKIIQSRVKALGATTNSIYGFAGGVNLRNREIGFNGLHYSHSRQFRSFIANEYPYWKSIFKSFELNTSVK